MDILCTADMCPVILNATCVFYEGNTLIYTGITTNDSLQTALQKIDAKFGDAMVGYTFTNGVYQSVAGAPVGLGGSLTANTSIGGNFTLTFVGNVKAAKHVTTGGTASQFVKGDGTLDSHAYQVAGNYITALTGDVIAAGPGSAAASLAVVNSNPGTYGSGTRIPVVTVDTKGRVTALTTTAINVPSGSLSFVGDVYGNGTTGSTTTLTLTNVNTNIYTVNSFLKFKVNAKGLVTGAAPITHVDIEGVLGYVPVPETRTITINGTTHDLQANVVFTLPGGGTVQSVSVTAGTGISASVANPTINPNITITNTAPDQVVTITGQSGIDVTGTYPNFTISANEEGAVTSVTASAPLASSGGQTPNITISQASASTNGYLSSTDWTTFNNKQNAIPYTPADDALVVHKAGTETITGQKTFDLSPITQVGLLLKNQSTTPYTTGYSGISADNGNFSLIKDNGVHAQLDLTNLTVNREYVFPNANGTLTLTSDLAAYQLLLNGTGLVRMAGTTVTYDNTSYTPQARTITINGTTYDLSANRSWSIDPMVYPSAGIAVSTGTAWGTSIVDNSTNWNTAYSLRLTSATAPLNITGTTISISQAGASANGFLSSTDWNTFNNKQPADHYITDLTGEASATGPGIATVTLNNSAVIGKVLTGVNITGGTVVATDTILEAFGKVQNQINGLVGGSIYKGVWNAATNTPTITSSVGTLGWYYIVNVAGTTNINGVTDWQVGDWIIFNGTVWNKVDNTDAVVSVNGYTGAVNLVTTDIPEGTNLYFTQSRARQSISLTTTGTSGAATYNDATGILNIPQYQGGVTSFNTRTGAITLTSLDVTTALGYTPVTNARTITINGTTYDLSANRTWSIDSMIYPAAGIAVSTGTAWAASITDNSTNWNTAYTLRISSLTTTGSSGAATLSSNVLNIPNYTLSGLGGVPSTRTITINSTSHDLSADASWDVGTVTSVAALTIGTTGTDLSSSVATGTTTPVITLNVPTASATNRGALSSTDWSTFNSKQAALSGTGFVKISGTTISYDNSTYALDSAVVHNTGNESISGVKTFTTQLAGAQLRFSESGGFGQVAGYTQIGGTADYFNFVNGNNTKQAVFNYGTGGTGYTYTLPNSNGTLALTSALSSYLPLIGGTLTGALSGTSATFSGTISTAAGYGILSGGGSFAISPSSTRGIIALNGSTDQILTFSTQSYIYNSSSLFRMLSSSDIDFVSGGSQRMIIKNTGNVGIGTTSPASLLHIDKSSNSGDFGVYPLSIVRNSLATQGDGSTTYNFAASLIQSGNGAVQFYRQTSYASGAWEPQGILNVYSNHPMTFKTNNTERMRITSGGNVGIGLTNPQTQFQMNGVLTFSEPGYDTVRLQWIDHAHSSGSDANNFMRFYVSNGSGTSSERLRISGSGDVTHTSYSVGQAILWKYNGGATYGFYNAGNGTFVLTNSGVANVGSFNMSNGIYTPLSDKNKKKDFEDSNIGLNEIMNLKPTLYRMNTDNSEGIKELGFIAQEVKNYIPNAYVESGDFIGLNFNPIVAALTKAVQELKAELDTLKNK